MAKISVKLTGLEKLGLREFAGLLSNMKEPMNHAAIWLRMAIIRDTRKGKKPGGGAYHPYSEGYKRKLHGQGFDAKKTDTKLRGAKKWLQVTGDMLDSIQTRSYKRQAKVGYMKRSKESMLANVHHKGKIFRRPAIEAPFKKALWWPGLAHPVKRVKAATISIPARPFVSWRRGYKEHITNNIFFPWIAKMAKRAGVRFKLTSDFGV